MKYENHFMEFLQPGSCTFLYEKCLEIFVNLNIDHHCIIFRVLWATNHVDGRKLFVAIQGSVSSAGRGFLKRFKISVGHESATDIVAEAVSIIALIQHGEGDSSTKWPCEPVISIPLHHTNKQANVTSISTIIAFWVDTHEELVSIQTSVNRRAIK